MFSPRLAVVQARDRLRSFKCSLEHILQTSKSVDKRQGQHKVNDGDNKKAITFILSPLSCGCGSAGVAVHFDVATQQITVSHALGQHKTGNQQPPRGAPESGEAHIQALSNKVPICCITSSSTPIPALSSEHSKTIPNIKFVTLRVWVSSKDELHRIEGFMDTGAEVSIMRKSIADQLGLNYSHMPPVPLIPFGGYELEACGYVPNVSLKTACKEVFQTENFFVVPDHQMPEKKDAYLSLDLIRRLEHLVRVVCVGCDR